MSSEPIVRLAGCGKLFLTHYHHGRRHAFFRVFLGRKHLTPKDEAHALHALKDLNLEIKSGEKMLISGPPESGKTVLGFLLAGTMRPSSGTITLPKSIAYFGKRADLPSPLLTLRQFIAFTSMLVGNEGEKKPGFTATILANTRLEDRARAFVRDLTREELERVRFEMIRECDCEVLVLDEPPEEVLVSVLSRPDFASRTIIVLSRKLRGALQPCARLVLLKQGTVQFDGSWLEGAPIHAAMELETQKEFFPGEEEESDAEGDTDESENEPLTPEAKQILLAPRPGHEELNDYLFRTAGKRRGKGGLLIESVSTEPDPNPSERQTRLTLSASGDQNLFVRLKVLDHSLIGKRLTEVNCRLLNAAGAPLVTLSSLLVGWQPPIEKEELCALFTLGRFGVTPGTYGFRVGVTVEGELQDKVELMSCVSVLPGEFFTTGYFPKTKLGEVCLPHSVQFVES